MNQEHTLWMPLDFAVPLLKEAGFDQFRANIEETNSVSRYSGRTVRGTASFYWIWRTSSTGKESRVRISKTVFVRTKTSDVSMSKCSEKTFSKTSDT